MKKSISIFLCSFSALVLSAEVVLAGPQPVALAAAKEIFATPIEATASKAKTRSGTSLIVRNTDLGEAGYKQELIVAPPSTRRATTVPLLLPPHVIKKVVPPVTATNDKERYQGEIDEGETDQDPQFLQCNSRALVEILANEITYGAGGPQVPTRLGYSIDGGSAVPMYGGGNVALHMTEEIALSSNQVLSFIGRSAYPDFNTQYPWINYNVPSDDAVNAAILINGSNFFTIAAAKGVQMVPYGMQQSLQQILGNMIDWNTGLVILPANKVIVLFELGATSPSSPAFDFNDLIVSITTDCNNAAEVVLRDSIGPDNALTNGQRVISSWVTSISGYDYVSFSLTPAESVTLTELTAVIGSPFGQSPAIVWNAFNYFVKIWSSPQARVLLPTIGDVMNCAFPFPSNFSSNDYVPPVFGGAFAQAPFNWETGSYLATFNLLNDPNVSCPVVNLQSGVEYAFAIQPIRPSFVNTSMGVVTSREVGTTDWRYLNSGPSGFPITAYSTPSLPLTGRVGFRLVGVPQ